MYIILHLNYMKKTKNGSGLMLLDIIRLKKMDGGSVLLSKGRNLKKKDGLKIIVVLWQEEMIHV